MKNRTFYSEFRKNGKIFCWHNWEVCEDVGPDWDLVLGCRILCKCLKCDKIREVSANRIAEVPDERINGSIRYGW